MTDRALHSLDETTGIATITLNRPDKRNALNPPVIDALKTTFEKAQTDERARVILLNANGQDFCAGADLAHLETTLDWSAEELVADAQQLGNLFIQMRNLPKPIIAAVHGNALAGGCGLATACDVLFAAESAHFGYPEIHIGFVPAMVMTMLIRNVGEKRAFDLVATGRRITAQEGQAIGIVNRVVADHELETATRGYCAELATKSASALAVCKSLTYELGEQSFEHDIENAAAINARARQTEEARRGFEAFTEGNKN